MGDRVQNLEGNNRRNVVECSPNIPLPLGENEAAQVTTTLEILAGIGNLELPQTLDICAENNTGNGEMRSIV
jgi:hypothetical protein